MGLTMSCKKGRGVPMSHYLSIFISLSCLRNEEAITSTWIRISLWQVFNFLLYWQPSILQDILFYIWYLTICFWIDWVLVAIVRTGLHRFMGKWKLFPSIPEGCGLYFPPWRASGIPMGRVQEETISKGVGSGSQGLFFQGLWNKNDCFYWWCYINSYSWMLFSQLTCMI